MLVQQAYKCSRGLPRCAEVAARFARCFVGDVVISSITLRGLGGAPYQLSTSPPHWRCHQA